LCDRLRERDDQLCTSALAVGETLVAPCKRGADDIIECMERFLASGVEVLPFTESTAIHFAKIRARYSIDPADAINLACVADARTDLFITNHASLVGKSVAGIQFIVDLNTNLF
jgi:predicted nucleic acid-binding protein